MLIGALEAGGTKMVCALGREDGTIIALPISLNRFPFRLLRRRRLSQRSQHTSKIRELKRWELELSDLWE